MEWLNNLLTILPLFLIGYTRDWLENTPADHTKFKAQPGAVREHKVDISDRLKNLFYGFTAGETTEAVKKLAYYAQGTAPSSMANAILSFGSDVAGKCEKYYLTEDGTFMQITRLGKILLSPGILPNNTNLEGINAAGTGVVNIIKLNASDLPELLDGALLASAAAPGTDAAIANKKYVDDSVPTLPSFGNWVDKSGGYGAQQAATDGFVIYGASGNPYGGSIKGYTDGNADPTTLRAQWVHSGSSQGGSGSCCFPVKKDDYWKIVVTSGTLDFAFWIPCS